MNAALVCGEVQKDWIEIKYQIRNGLKLLIASNGEVEPDPTLLSPRAICRLMQRGFCQLDAVY